jgi:hypothetical protein
MGDFLMKWGVYGHLILCNLAVLRAEKVEAFYLLFNWVQSFLALCLEECRRSPYRPHQVRFLPCAQPTISGFRANEDGWGIGGIQSGAQARREMEFRGRESGVMEGQEEDGGRTGTDQQSSPHRTRLLQSHQHQQHQREEKDGGPQKHAGHYSPKRAPYAPTAGDDFSDF